MSTFDNATLMITGGTGSFGSTVLKHFLDSDLKEIRIFSRDEKKQDDMRHELQAKHPEAAKKVKFYIGDVRNPQSIRDAIQSVFFEAISTSVILLPVSALLGFDDNIWNILENELLRINLLFCCCFYIAVFSFWSNYGINWPRNASYKGIFSCWFTSACIMTFIEFHKKNKRKIIYCNLLFIIAAAFITQSRGWVLQTLVLLFVFVAVLGNRNRYVKFLMGLLLIFIAILGVSYVFPEITGNLFNRGVEDTRSGQYVIFFAQHSWKDLILGLGINASYSYLGNVNYTYFDNQFMFVMFHYGIFPVIVWLCVYASILKNSKIYNGQNRIVIQAAKFVGLFVLLAYMGVSTYYQIELGYNGVIVMILIGKALREKYYGKS